MRENLDIGRVVSQVFETYRAQASLLIPAAAIVYLVLAVVNFILGLLARGVASAILVSILALVISAIGSAWLAGMVVNAVRDMQDGRRDLTLGGLFESATPVIGALILVGIIFGFGVGIGLILLIVPGLILLTWWSVVAPVTVIERPGVGAAFSRSRELVRGNGWQVFGVLVIFFLILFVAQAIIGAIIGGIIQNAVGVALANVIAGALVGPLPALGAAVLYFSLRGIKEGAGAVGGGPATAGVGAAPGAPAPSPPPGAAAPPPATAPPPGGPPPSGPPPGGPPGAA